MSDPFSGLAGRYLASSETLLGIVRHTLTALFEESGIELVQCYGVRVFTDHLGDRPPSPNLQDILGLEWEACRRDPYRSVARLLHLVGLKSSGRKFKSWAR